MLANEGTGASANGGTDALANKANGEDFWESLKVQLDTMMKVENWNFSTLDKCKIINETDKTLQCEVNFNRRLINKKSYGQICFS